MCKDQYPLSIITVSFNSEKSIERTLISISEQSFRDFELVVIDGASTDGTLRIVSKYQGIIDMKVVSEPDGGIYYAMNKGIELSRGSIIGFLNSDDYFSDSFVLERIMKEFSVGGVSAVYGDLEYITNNNRKTRHWKAGVFHNSKLLFGWMPPHPTLYLRKQCFDDVGLFDTSLKISSDYDFVLRFFGSGQYSVVYIPELLVSMKVGGVSNGSIKNILKKMIEDIIVIHRYNLCSIVTLFFKNASKVSQFYN